MKRPPDRRTSFAFPAALRRIWLGLGLAAALVPATGALAQDRTAQKHLTLLGITSATTAPSGTVFGSLSLTSRRGGVGKSADGSAELGFGLGDARNGIGLQFSAVVTSLSNNLGDSGYLNFKAARQIAGGRTPTFIGLEVDHIGNWGQARRSKPGVNLALTTFGQAQMGAAGNYYPYMVTLGVGSRLRANRTKPGVFLGAGLGLSENLALSAAWTGEAVDLGAGLRLTGLPNTYFSAAVNDAFDTRNSRRVTVSIGWALADVFGR